MIIKSSKELISFMKTSLNDPVYSIKYFTEETDVGLLLKKDTLQVDHERLEHQLVEFINTWDRRAEDEELFLKNHKVSLVVSDIVPWIFKSCNNIGIESILISNFTWVEIYKELFGVENKIFQSFLECYKLADRTLIYPLAQGLCEYAVNPKMVGLSCREFNDEFVGDFKSNFDLPIVYVGLGRSVHLNRKINVQGLPYTFIYTEGIELVGSNCLKLPLDVKNTHDYIKASDYVITKAGWSTLSEAICARKPLIVFNRPEIAEDKASLKILLDLDIAIGIEEHEFDEFNIKNKLEIVGDKKRNYTYIGEYYTDHSASIAKEICK